jgi:L-ascorbate metabolism protein UlaG (beta-lactamase superfamily)
MTPKTGHFEKDVVKTSGGDLEITFIGHASLMFAYGGKIIHVDPVTAEADYKALPKADLIVITHDHYDHLDCAAVEALSKPGTEVVAGAPCEGKVAGAIILKNGQSRKTMGIAIEAVPAYNILHLHSPGHPFHPKGEGNGYVLTFGDKKVYIAGDTENIPEMAKLKDIDVAFLPMNLPYTMSPEMAADAALKFRPKVLYPYHYGDTDAAKLGALLKNEKGIEVRVRKMK